MSESSYDAGLVGAPLNNLLGTIELLEGYGLPGDPGEPYYDSSGILTIGYGFALTTRNSHGQIVANTNVLAAVLDGLLPAGETYVAGGNNYNVFVAASEASSPLTYDKVLAYFSWLVQTYGTESVTPLAQTFESEYLTEALQQFYAGNGAALYNNGIFLLPVEGVASQSAIKFSFSPDDTTNAEQVLSNLITGASINEGAAAGILPIHGYSPQLYSLLQKHGLVDTNGDVEGAAASSPQWAALVASYYNGLPGGTSHGLADGDAAESWFSLRYKTPSPARGYVEAQLFGLNGGSMADPTTLAFQDFEMLTEHRDAIVLFEQAYGIDPNSPMQAAGKGIVNAFRDIQAAQTDPSASFIGPLGTLPSALQSIGSEFDLSLSQNFNPEADLVISYLESTYGSVIPQITNATEAGLEGSGFDVNSTDIFAAPPEQDVVDGFATDAQMDVDAELGDPGSPSGLDEAEADHIILGTGSGDTLRGGLGDDLIVAGTGNETLIAGAGSDTLIGGGGDDTVQLGTSSDVVDFQFPSSSGYTETILDSAGGAGGAVYLNGLELGTAASGLISFGTDTWEDFSGNIYTFQADPPNAPLIYSPGTAGPYVGELQILVGGQGGNEIDIWGFNLSEAEQSAGGDLGIKLRPSLALTAGSTAGVDPPAADFTAGSTQLYTVSMDAPSTLAQIVTVALTGAPAADFGLVLETSVIPISGDGLFTVTIPAGQTSASFSLANTGDVGAAAGLDLVASIPDPSDPTAETISSAPLTQNYIEPTDDPFSTPSNGTLYYLGADITSGGLAYNFYGEQDGAVLSPTVVAGAGAGNNYIFESGEPNSSINGGTGNDTIFAQFGYKQADGGVDVISGDGGQDDILASGGASDGLATIRIYGTSETDLATAIADANTAAATGEVGDLIVTADPGTVVGGNGNDLILTGDGGVVVAGPGDDTIAAGAPELYTTTDWTGNSDLPAPGPHGVTWSTSLSNGSLEVQGGSITLGRLADAPPPSQYEGNYDDTGGIFASTDDTIFGGAGHDLIYLSNGNDEVHLGIGDSTVNGGMGSDTILAGSGNDCIVGGGGSDYIASGGGNDWIMGRGGNNTIFGGSGADTISAGGATDGSTPEETGNDYVQAGSGNTLIFGSGGNDTLIGGSGTDTIQAGNGNESIVAGSGDTSINGGNGPDTIVAGSGSDTIWGSTQSTTIYGGTGVDSISGRGGEDVIYAGDGGTSQTATTITAGSGDTTIYGGEGVDLILGGSGNNVIYAGDGGTADTPTEVLAGSGDTTIYGGDGFDSIVGGSGTDILYAGDGGDDTSPSYVTAGTGVATLYGGAGASVLTDSDGGSDVLEAGSGDSTLQGIGQDTLIAGSGSDYLAGGVNSTYSFGSDVGVDEVANEGAETLDFDSSVDSSDFSLSAAIDTTGGGALTMDEGEGSIIIDGGLTGANVAAVDFEGSQSMSLSQLIQQEVILGNVVEQTLAGTLGNLIFDASAGDSVNAGTGEDTISAWGDSDTLTAGTGGTQIYAEGVNDSVMGGAGNDTLDAAAAGTTLVGGTGNEVFEVDDTTDVVQGQANAASNQIYTSVSYTLPTNVDVLTLTGTDDLSAAGNDDANNIITGNAGDDTLIAGSGSDTLVSGSGDDTFVINSASDVIELGSTFGDDIVESSVSYTLQEGLDTLELIGTADLEGQGNADVSNTLEANDGNDTLIAGSGSDWLIGGAGNDTLIGGSGFDTMIGGSGATTFVAGRGVDVFVAVSGDNTFVINNANDDIELDTAGNDTVESSVSYTLEQGLDTLELTGGANLNGQGNADASNLLEANSGNDTLIAGSGDDTLVAGSGTDVLEGGAGSTTYVLNSGFGQVEIKPGSGSGVIQLGDAISPTNLTVGLTTDSRGNLALLIHDGSGAVTVDGGFTGTINSFEFSGAGQLSLAEFLAEAGVVSGTVSGSSGTAMLDSSGNTSLLGGYGDDTLIGTGASDTVLAGTGNQELFGAGDGDVVAGGAGDDTLYGGAGDDTLIGGTGNAVMYGGSGTDSIVLTRGGTATFYPSATPGGELIQLPVGMTLGDFRSLLDASGDLILQSLTGDTTAVIKGYADGADDKTWVISDSTGASELLKEWLVGQQQSPSGYTAEMDNLRQEFAANLVTALNQIGEDGGTIVDPGRLATGPDINYQFNGVDVENDTVQGGAIELPSSEGDQRSSTVLSEPLTYTLELPQYGLETGPSSSFFVPSSDPNAETEAHAFSGSDVEFVSDSGGEQGYEVTLAPVAWFGVTGTTTQTITVPQDTFYTQESQTFTAYNVTGDGGDDSITGSGNFVGTVLTGNGNVSVGFGLSDIPTVFGHPQFSGYPLPPGAFIEAGSGNDNITGTGGADVIAAGTGFDNIFAAAGSTVYVPLQGTSTEHITIAGLFYGSGPWPQSTLMLPDGITPQDLSYRVITDVEEPNAYFDGSTLTTPGEELQITYGGSTVLLDFGFNARTDFNASTPSDDHDGIDQFQFADGTVLTRDQIIAMAGPAVSASDFDPTVSALNPAVTANSTIAGASLFSGSDSSGSSIAWYQISNSGAGGGSFALDGAVQAPGQTFYVSSEQLPELEYVAGASGSADAIEVSAFDGVVWGATEAFNVEATSAGYQATGPNQEVTGSATGPDTLVGGYGGDTLVGSSGQDTFAYSAGSGAEVISETAPVSWASDNGVQFGSGITPLSISLSESGDPQLVLSIGSAGDSVTIDGFDPLNPLQSFPIQSFAFADGTSLSLLQLLGDSAVTGSSGSITNTDGSITTYQFTPVGQQLYYAQTENSDGQLIDSLSLNEDGSEVADSYSYNADGKYSDTMVSTPAGGGGSTTTVYEINSQGQEVSKDITNPDGSTDDSIYTYNADGSSTQTEVVTPAGGGGSTTTVYYTSSDGQGSSVDITYPDGSTDDSTYAVNPDGSYIKTEVVTPPGGGGATTTVYYVDSQGNWTAVDVTYPDGSTDNTAYTSNADGSSSTTDVATAAGGGAPTTTMTDYNSQSQITSLDITYPDGSTDDTTYTFNADGSSTTTEAVTSADGGCTTWVTGYNGQGQKTVFDIANPDGSTDVSTYTYIADGSYTQTEVITPAGGSPTTTVYNIDSQGQVTYKGITSPDGSTDNNAYSYNADGTYTQTEVVTPAGGGSTTTVTDFNSQGEGTSVDITYPDGSTDNATYTYNPDESVIRTGVVTPADGGGSTTTVTDYNSQGQWTSLDIIYPDGSTDNTAYIYNADGSSTTTDVVTAAGGGSTTTVYNVNSQGQETSKNITNPDGSTDDSTFTYNADGSNSQTEVVTPADGGGSTTTVYYSDSDGQGGSVDITYPDGSTDDTSYTRNADGSGTTTEVAADAGGASPTTTVTDFNSQGQWTSADVTKPDGSTDDSAYTYNADGSSSKTEVVTPAGGGAPTTSVFDYSAEGNLESENDYTLSSNGSYSDAWSQADGSHGTYWWNSSTSMYEGTWYDGDGSSFTDEYQYASGGSPGASGYSFLETYSGIDGSQGMRQYDASTGAITLSWDSTATGALSGTTTDSGFIGLQNDSELTSTQEDLTFFNPNVSSSFNAFLAAH